MANVAAIRRMDLGFDLLPVLVKKETSEEENSLAEETKATVAQTADKMSLHPLGPNTIVVKHNGQRVGQITKTRTKSGEKTYVVSHDENGEHPDTFSTQQGAKAGMAEMHVGEPAKKAEYLRGEFDAYKRDFSDAERKELAKTGKALPDGSFPIVTTGDLDNAIGLAGNASNPEKAKAHIKTRAKALGAEDKIPATWKNDPANNGMPPDFPNNLQTDPTDPSKDTMQADPEVDQLEHVDEPDFKKILFPTAYTDASIQRNRQATPNGAFDPNNAIS